MPFDLNCVVGAWFPLNFLHIVYALRILQGAWRYKKWIRTFCTSWGGSKRFLDRYDIKWLVGFVFIQQYHYGSMWMSHNSSTQKRKLRNDFLRVENDAWNFCGLGPLGVDLFPQVSILVDKRIRCEIPNQWFGTFFHRFYRFGWFRFQRFVVRMNNSTAWIRYIASNQTSANSKYKCGLLWLTFWQSWQ